MRNVDKARLQLLNVAMLTLCSILQMGLQFLLLTLIAWWFGTSRDVDSFNSAIAVPIALSAVLAAPLPLVLVPEMVRLETCGRRGQALRLASALLAGFFALGTCLSAAIYFLPVASAAWMFGFEDEGLLLTADFLRRLAWLIPLNGAITILQAIYHAKQRFLLAALSTLFGVSVPLAWVAVLSTPSLLDIADGTVAGAVIAVLILLLPIHRELLSGWREEQRLVVGVGRFLLLLAPLFFAGIFPRVDPLIDRIIASYAALPVGSIAELGYAQRLTMALTTLISGGLSVVIFPQLAAAAGASVPQRMAQLLAVSFRFLIFLLVPCIIAVLVFAPAIVAELFQRGAFGSEATRMVALLLRILMAVLVAGSLGEIAAKALYACGNTRGPALVAVGGFTLGVVLKLTLTGPLGIAGIATGTAIYYLVNVALLLIMIKMRFGHAAFSGSASSFFYCTLSSVIAAGFGAIPVVLMSRGGAVVGGVVGLLVYLLSQSLLRSEFVPRHNPIRSLQNKTI